MLINMKTVNNNCPKSIYMHETKTMY